MSITLLIIIVTVVTSLYSQNKGLLSKYVMNPYQVFHRKEYWRMITSGFIHSGYIHLGFNMFTLYFFGNVVEQIFKYILGNSTGSVVFILFYLIAIVISDLPTAFKNRNNPGYNSLGASGAVSAMVFGSILFMPLNEICLYAIFCLPGFILGGLYVIYSYYSGRSLSDNINHEAHLYGALFGVIFSLIVYPEAAPQFFRQISTYRPF